MQEQRNEEKDNSSGATITDPFRLHPDALRQYYEIFNGRDLVSLKEWYNTYYPLPDQKMKQIAIEAVQEEWKLGVTLKLQ